MSRVAVVSGSNKGIGFACVRALCKQLKPEDVVYLTARNPELGQKAVADLEKEGLKPRFHQLDILKKGSVEELRDHLQKEHGGLDILINNAATAFKMKDAAPFAEQARVTCQVNYFGTTQTCRILSPLLRPYARVVNVSSIVSVIYWKRMGESLKEEFRNLSTEEEVDNIVHRFIELAAKDEHLQHGFPSTAYGLSKIALAAFTRIQDKTFEKDASRPGIVAFSADPGAVPTDMSSWKGHMTADEGADTPVWLALRSDTDGRGEMFTDRKLNRVIK